MKKKQIEFEYQYKRYSALAIYIDRIGAEQLNFRKFMVKEHKGHYYTEKAIIVIKDDGTILCKNKEYKPTPLEEEAIKLQLQDETKKWPKATGAKNIDDLVKMLKVNKKDLFEFYDRSNKTDQIIMVQQKIVKPDGSKAYVPWTKFNDGKWLNMEPDGLLPFWKPKYRMKAKIMIHEGAKCGAFANWLCTSDSKEAVALRKTHPWSDELMDYEHWGMIGGALAPHRTNYDELAREKPIEVVYFCDNDWKGKKALELISPSWGKALKGIKLDGRWPEAWDIADELTIVTCPKLFSNETGRYLGDSIRQLLSPATFATKLVTTAETAGRPVIVAREEFMQEWYHCVRPEVFFHKDYPNREYTINEFNNLVAPFSQSKDTGSIIKKDGVQKGATLIYRPGEPPGISFDRSGTKINMHVPTHIKPENGNVSIWENYMKLLFPNEKDRKEVLRWCATLIAHPEVKMSYGLLLISVTQGVGKTTLGQDILAPLMGDTNTSYPTEHEVTDSTFNYWEVNKRLAIVNEIYSGDNSKSYNRLKSTITEKMTPVSKKYQASYEIENWVHVFACSNSWRALKIETGERRWLVPEVSEDKQTQKYWNKLHDWLDHDNGLGKIMAWAMDYCKKNGHIKKGEEAPNTERKKEVAKENMAPELAQLSTLLETLKEKRNGTGEGIITTDVHLQDYIKEKINNGIPNKYTARLLTIRKHAKSEGWFVSDEFTKLGEWGGSSDTKARLIFSNPNESRLSVEKLSEKGKKPFNLNGLKQKM